MTREEFASLQRGDIVRGDHSAESLIVMGNFGGRVTAARIADLTNPSEWKLIARANHTEHQP